MAALVEKLDWDSEFFARRIGRARVGRLDDAIARRLVEEATAAGLECVYFIAAIDDLDTVLAAEAHGFHLVDVRVVLERATDLPLPDGDDRERFVIDGARADDLPRLEEIARQVARQSRYAFDRRFAPADTERLYRTWVGNALAGYADAVLVAREAAGGPPLGFVCCKMHGELCDLQLVGVDVAHRQRRIAHALLCASLGWATGRGARRLQMVTQARNVAAQRLCQGLGFLTREVSLYYHLWLPPPAPAR
jgi:dTDP-4-amino-4,6-dideoxy-D-galactose acyltransferase